MGKKRIKVIGAEQEQDKEKSKKSVFKEKKLKKAGKGEGRLADMGVKALEEAEKIKKKVEEVEKVSTDAKAVADKEKVEKVKALKKPKRVRSRRYRLIKTKVDRDKLYSLSEAVKILLSIADSKIDETVEVHVSTHEKKLTGIVKLPHGTGKTQKVAIADDELIDKINKGKVDFDVLIATPQIMPKIAKVAKILGPKGLMPSPKTGTISENPEELKKKMKACQELRFKTEAKAPLIHLVIGKISLGEEKILENLKAVIEAIGPKKIKKAVLTSTHSPGIKLGPNLI